MKAIFNLNTPAGQIYVCSLLFLLMVVFALCIRAVIRRSAQRELTAMPWWGWIALAFPHVLVLIPGSDKWSAPKAVAYPIIGFALLCTCVIALIALAGIVFGLADLR